MPQTTPQSTRPFEFLIDLRDIVPGKELAEKARQAEAAGYHEIVFPDHLIPQLGPITAMAWVAQATDKIRIAAFVFNNDLRHPVVLAQELASLDVLSEGRVDVAIGAGWNVPEYEALGIPFDPTPVRQARLAEAIQVLKGAFGDDEFSFEGEHYTITSLDGQPKPIQRPSPPFMIGGGGRRTLELAGREADIVSLAPRILPNRKGDANSITFAATAEKIDWVKAAAGDRFDQITLNVYPSQAPIIVTDHPREEIRKAADDIRKRSGIELTENDLLEAPNIFIGSVGSLVEKFQMLRDRLGISSYMCGTGGDLDPVVERLAGT
jgi:probable F420-dependent oxidoreductase